MKTALCLVGIPAMHTKSAAHLYTTGKYSNAKRISHFHIQAYELVPRAKPSICAKCENTPKAHLHM